METRSERIFVNLNAESLNVEYYCEELNSKSNHTKQASANTRVHKNLLSNSQTILKDINRRKLIFEDQPLTRQVKKEQ